MTLMKAYRMHLKENVALLQTKGLVFIIYSMVVCAYLIPSTEVTNHAKEMNLSWCLARVFSQHSSDCKWQTQNSKWLKEKWNYMDAEESHEKNGTIKLWKRQEFRWASGTVKPRIQYIVILFPFPIAFVYLFFSLTPNGLWLPIQKKKKKRPLTTPWVFYLWCQSSKGYWAHSVNAGPNIFMNELNVSAWVRCPFFGQSADPSTEECTVTGPFWIISLHVAQSMVAGDAGWFENRVPQKETKQNL